MFQKPGTNWVEQRQDAMPVDVSIIMPCLNEIISLPHCIANAQDALQRIEKQYGLSGEIVIADNGSTDGSQALAQSLGARVVPVPRKGYGAALIGGCEAAFGQYLLMGDCDGSYNFTEGVAMIGKLLEGYDVCMGSRFDGGIAPGAMPWKNRYIGNPVLTGILNLFFRSGINDAHCGLRAIRKTSFAALGLSGTGMEFASEMVIKATLKQQRMTQVPATLSVDLRERAPHLRPWRDGWRHLRYLLMLSPTWVFGVPAMALGLVGLAILAVALLQYAGVAAAPIELGASWILVGSSMATLAHMAAIIALASHLYGVRSGYRIARPTIARIAGFLSLETLLVGGLGLTIAGLIGIGLVTHSWSAHGYAMLPSILPLSLSCVAGVIGMQTVFGAFLMAILGGHDAAFASKSLFQVHH